jgi:hypothetical protein
VGGRREAGPVNQSFWQSAVGCIAGFSQHWSAHVSLVPNRAGVYAIFGRLLTTVRSQINPPGGQLVKRYSIARLFALYVTRMGQNRRNVIIKYWISPAAGAGV